MGVVVQLSDLLTFAVAGVLAYRWRFEESLFEAPRALVELWVAASLFMMVAGSLVYRAWRGGQLMSMLGRVGVAWLITWGTIMTFLVLTQTSIDYSRLWLGYWALASLGLAWAGRVLVYFFMSWMQGVGVNETRVLLVGSGQVVHDIRRRVKSSAWSGYRVVGVTPGDSQRTLEEIFHTVQPDEVWICQQPGDMRTAQNVLHTLRHSTVNIRLVPDLTMLQLVNHGVSIVVGVPMLDISSSPMQGINEVVKWLEDKILAISILTLIAPLMLGIAVAVKLSSPGPILFRQKRLGWNNEVIHVYKFRSMYVHDEGDRVTQARRNDARVTPVGRFLRRTSLDELPQFFNVLQGTMSVVGPRPHAIEHNRQYQELIPRYMLRHKVKPGITGWAQVNGLRGETDTLEKMQARIQADIYYIENWSLWLDLKIVFLTLFRGFVHRNAY